MFISICLNPRLRSLAFFFDFFLGISIFLFLAPFLITENKEPGTAGRLNSLQRSSCNNTLSSKEQIIEGRNKTTKPSHPEK